MLSLLCTQTDGYICISYSLCHYSYLQFCSYMEYNHITLIVIVIFLQGVHSVKLIFSGALFIHTHSITNNYHTKYIYTKDN